MELVEDSYPHTRLDLNIRWIALTPVDIWLESQPSWGWAFGRLGGSHFMGPDVYLNGVISTYRMDERSWGGVQDDELLYSRVRKLLSKYIAATLYAEDFSSDPHSVMYNGIRSPEDLDRMGERIPGR
jgi:hypothetical protein